MFAQAREELGGPVDLLVNNAGIETPFKLVDMPLEEWDRVIGVNLTGAFLCAREAARGMARRGSRGDRERFERARGDPVGAVRHYCASKGGMKLWAQTTAKELAPHGSAW